MTSCLDCCYCWREDWEDRPHCHWTMCAPGEVPPCEDDDYKKEVNKMNSYNIIYKKSRGHGCLRSVIINCPVSSQELSPEEKINVVASIFSKANPKCRIIAILPVDRDEET